MFDHVLGYQVIGRFLPDPLHDSDFSLVLLRRGQNDYMTAYYRRGGSEWFLGHYFADIQKAANDFAERACGEKMEVPFYTDDLIESVASDLRKQFPEFDAEWMRNHAEVVARVILASGRRHNMEMGIRTYQA